MKSSNFFYVHISGAVRKLPIRSGESVLEHVLRANIDLGHSCEGMGTCTTCRIRVSDGSPALTVPNEIEQERITERGFQPSERLACQIEPVEDLHIVIPPQ